MYEYKAKVERVVDGDTLCLSVDLGFDISRKHSCRLHGINANEHDTIAGEAAKAFLTDLCPVGTPVIVQTIKDRDDKFGRVLGIVTIVPKPAKAKRLKKGEAAALPEPMLSINDQLVEAGHALRWDGKGIKPI
jgi:micrococcal nuclease